MRNIVFKNNSFIKFSLAGLLFFTACEDKSIEGLSSNENSYQTHKPESSPFIINRKGNTHKVKKLKNPKRFLRRIDLALRKDRKTINCYEYHDSGHSAPYSGLDFYDYFPVLFDSPDPVHCPLKIGMQLYEYSYIDNQGIPYRERTRIEESTPLKLQSITKFGIFTAIEQELGSSQYHTPLGRRIITVNKDGIIIDIEECQEEDKPEHRRADYLKAKISSEERIYKVGEKVFFYLDLSGSAILEDDGIEWELNFGDGIIKYGLIKDFEPITYHTYSKAGTYRVIFATNSRFGGLSSVSKIEVKIEPSKKE